MTSRKNILQKFIRLPSSKRQLFVIVFVTITHIFFLFAMGNNVEGGAEPSLSIERVMRLSDISERMPEPVAPPETVVDVVQSLAEKMIETDEKVEQIAAVTGAVSNETQGTGEDEYQMQYKIEVRPVFDHRSIIPIYPPIALRTGIEGLVILELFIDKNGIVRRVIMLKENPEGKGFGEAAVAAFEGKKCTPAKDSSGENIAVRYRYPVRFAIRE
ncbi:MAG: hypothetical protein Ta2G_12210 [Termitinemataceae bacterium]|nr:MAG: hypothetical protein Ta2G_12210 [Termitinemataceae bacterium]